MQQKALRIRRAYVAVPPWHCGGLGDTDLERTGAEQWRYMCSDAAPLSRVFARLSRVAGARSECYGCFASFPPGSAVCCANRALFSPSNLLFRFFYYT